MRVFVSGHKTASLRNITRKQLRDIFLIKLLRWPRAHLGAHHRTRRMQLMISCFDYSCVMAQPWADAGHLCYCVDIKHPPGETRDGNIIRIGADMRDWLPPREPIAFAAFFPPCTDVAVSGARWFRDKGLRALIGALELFDVSVRLAEWTGARYIIENPVSTISTYWRKPDYIFDPCDYGDPYTKKTCLWAGRGFVMPAKQRVEATEGSKMHLLPPSANRAELRSETPPGFASAVFAANHVD